MITYTKPIRNKTPQLIGPYSFKDQNGTTIDLTNYSTASFEVKLQGQLYATIAGQIIAPATLGQVKGQNPYTFDGVGVWDIQFYVQDGSGNRLYGEPLQITVVPNVDDLALDELANY